jgi:hypothetical protein
MKIAKIVFAYILMLLAVLYTIANCSIIFGPLYYGPFMGAVGYYGFAILTELVAIKVFVKAFNYIK